jgi:DNA methylase
LSVFYNVPAEFPSKSTHRNCSKDDVVLDPFAGRGTTLYAARLLGLRAYGIDSNPVAVAISEAKLANTSPEKIAGAAKKIFDAIKAPNDVPTGEFWDLAFHQEVLMALCRLREGLIANCKSDERKALRAVVLGALHGPQGKRQQSYFSNQCPRTYAPKPRYATRYWRERNLSPARVNVLEIIRLRAQRFYRDEKTIASGKVVAGDSRKESSFDSLGEKVSWILTSPPYYGMRTYIPDQWLRSWFLGGPADVEYSNDGELSHRSLPAFRMGLEKVWNNCGGVAQPGCRLIVRFGAINDRKVDALSLLKESLRNSCWKILTCHLAGTASHGKRQADHFVPAKRALVEHDVWAELTCLIA